MRVIDSSGIYTNCYEFPDSDEDGVTDDPILDNEICGDLRDNTGDGRIDEGCPHDDTPDTPTTPPNGNHSRSRNLR